MKRFTKIFLSFLLSSITLLGYAIPLNIQSSNWYNQYLPNLNNRPLSDITFVDSLLGFGVTGDNTVGDTNYIIKTTNGGDNWNIIYSIYKDLTRVIFLNSNTGFVSGGYNGINGIILKTTNGGINWQLINVPDELRCDDMAVLNKDTILIVDQSGFDGVWRTTNGGNNWNLIYAGGFSVTPKRIYMYNSFIGFFCDDFYTFKTSNGGFNWTKINGEDGFTQIKFIDSLTGWKANGTLMKKSTDGGLNWVNQQLPIPSVGTISWGMYHFSLINKDTIWGVGGSYQYPNLQNRGVIYRTTNGGNNWLYQILDTVIIKIPNFHFIQFYNSKIGWVYTGNKGIHTKNGGDTVFLSVSKINSEIPSGYTLFQNYPNPFNSMTNVKVQMLKRGFAEIKIFDITGRLIEILIKQNLHTGEFAFNFNASDLTSGIYFYSLFVDGIRIDTKKLVLIK
jgi:photosystem II stability/assembly factor-like uncharacterized protein